MQMHHFMRPPAPAPARCKGLRHILALAVCSALLLSRLVFGMSLSLSLLLFAPPAVKALRRAMPRTLTYYGSYITQPAGEQKQGENWNGHDMPS
ncbi:hypothetical protein V8C34DRAFT_271534 [Trichoderma compactum]